ncbi:hypothetical protein J6590_014789 [Homalodisca vitripennis]|nr:hypothetical protein J6590_014789 [Homalodisca vitripennis]
MRFAEVEERFSCECCGRVYRYKCDLRRHQRYECGKEPQFACPHCTVMDLEGNPRFLCGLCGRHYKYKADRDRHQRQECGNERQFACTVCPYRARQKRTLKTHMVLPAGGGTILDPEGNLRFGCPVCGRLYKYRRDLGRHRRYECGIEPQFPCSACPYRAKQKGTLKTHMALKHNIS